MEFFHHGDLTKLFARLIIGHVYDFGGDILDLFILVQRHINARNLTAGIADSDNRRFSDSVIYADMHVGKLKDIHFRVVFYDLSA